ncbi:MAG: ShlB/FhaC/HecB family hemolysin secretion/activation protein [Verrucomicrobiota bacterium]
MRIVPKVVKRADGETTVMVPELPAAGGDSSVEAVGKISGIVLWGSMDEVQADSPPKIREVKVGSEDLEVPDGVLEALQAYLDGPLSVAAIENITRDVVLAYRKADLPVVDVGFPEQDVSSGVLQLVIVVGRVGEIRVTGAEYFDPEDYLKYIRLSPGDLIYQSTLLQDLRFLSRNPFRSLNLLYTPGKEFGDADMILEVDEQRPLTAYVGYDNTGNEFIGVDRLNFGFEWGNVFGLGHIVSYQYTTSVDFEGLQGHSLYYRAPIAATRGELRFLGGYVNTDVSIQAAGQTFNSGGESAQLSGVYVQPLPTWWGIEQDLHVGFDFKTTDNNLEFGGLRVSDTYTQIYQFTVAQMGRKRSRFGLTQFYNRLVVSPGNFSGQNTDEVFNDLRLGATASYVYWNGSLTQMISLPKDFQLHLMLEGQASSNNLLPSESLILGGQGSVRGFEQNITRADYGAVANIELYTPAFSPLSGLGLGGKDAVYEGEGGKRTLIEPGRKMEEGLRFLAFLDLGWGGSVDRLPREPSSRELAGAGAGLNYFLNSNLVLRAAYGWQVWEEGFLDAEDGRSHISVTMRW